MDVPAWRPGVEGHFRVELRQELARGGMGVVYDAWQPHLQRAVAVKVIRLDRVSDEAVSRFRREAQVMAGLEHRAIVPVYDFFEAEDILAILMRRYESSLADRLRMGALPEGDVADLAKDVGSALSVAHERGVTHRDVKPSNILYSPDGSWALADFGVAGILEVSGLTRQGSWVGTETYMAPEVFEGGGQTPSSDIYALGITLFEALTGTAPFRGTTPGSLGFQHVHREVPTFTCSSVTLQRVIDGCLAKRPEDRWASGGAVVEALGVARPRSGSAVDDVAPSEDDQVNGEGLGHDSPSAKSVQGQDGDEETVLGAVISAPAETVLAGGSLEPVQERKLLSKPLAAVLILVAFGLLSLVARLGGSTAAPAAVSLRSEVAEMGLSPRAVEHLTRSGCFVDPEELQARSRWLLVGDVPVSDVRLRDGDGLEIEPVALKESDAGLTVEFEAPPGDFIIVGDASGQSVELTAVIPAVRFRWIAGELISKGATPPPGRYAGLGPARDAVDGKIRTAHHFYFPSGPADTSVELRFQEVQRVLWASAMWGVDKSGDFLVGKPGRVSTGLICDQRCASPKLAESFAGGRYSLQTDQRSAKAITFRLGDWPSGGEVKAPGVSEICALGIAA
jgi:hypothetical protein